MVLLAGQRRPEGVRGRSDDEGSAGDEDVIVFPVVGDHLEVGKGGDEEGAQEGEGAGGLGESALKPGGKEIRDEVAVFTEEIGHLESGVDEEAVFFFVEFEELVRPVAPEEKRAEAIGVDLEVVADETTQGGVDIVEDIGDGHEGVGIGGDLPVGVDQQGVFDGRKVSGDIGLELFVEFNAQIFGAMAVGPGLDGTDAGVGSVVDFDPGVAVDEAQEVVEFEVALVGLADVDNGPLAGFEGVSKARNEGRAERIGGKLGEIVGAKEDHPVVDIFERIGDGDVEPVRVVLAVEEPESLAGGVEVVAEEAVVAFRHVTAQAAAEVREVDASVGLDLAFKGGGEGGGPGVGGKLSRYPRKGLIGNLGEEVDGRGALHDGCVPLKLPAKLSALKGGGENGADAGMGGLSKEGVVVGWRAQQ